MQRLSFLREEVEQWNLLAQRVQDAQDLAVLDDESLAEELAAEGFERARQVAQAIGGLVGRPVRVEDNLFGGGRN